MRQPVCLGSPRGILRRCACAARKPQGDGPVTTLSTSRAGPRAGHGNPRNAGFFCGAFFPWKSGLSTATPQASPLWGSGVLAAARSGPLQVGFKIPEIASIVARKVVALPVSAAKLTEDLALAAPHGAGVRRRVVARRFPLGSSWRLLAELLGPRSEGCPPWGPPSYPGSKRLRSSLRPPGATRWFPSHTGVGREMRGTGRSALQSLARSTFRVSHEDF